jgi:hypothetical protein
VGHGIDEASRQIPEETSYLNMDLGPNVYTLIFVVEGMFEIGSYSFYPLASHHNPELRLCRSKDARCEPQVPGLCKYLMTLTGARVNVMRRHFKGRECQYCNGYCLMNTAIRQILKQGLWQTHNPEAWSYSAIAHIQNSFLHLSVYGQRHE